MKKYICFLFFIFWINQSYSQESSFDCKYFSALIYLKSNKEINDYLKKWYGKFINKKEREIDFKISKKVEFINLLHFPNKTQIEKYGIPSEYLTDRELYRSKYYFDSYENNNLLKIMDENESKLYLTFSLPIDNYLLLEIGHLNPEEYINHTPGLRTKILLIFDDNNIVIDRFQVTGSVN